MIAAGIAVLALVVILTVAFSGGSEPQGEAPAGPAAAGGEPATGAAPAAPPAKVRVAQATVMSVRDRFTLVGRLEQQRQAVVAAEVAGKVVEVPVEEGQPVEGGETVLAQIEAVWAQLDLAAASADVAAAQATLDQSQSDLNYLESLLASNAAKPKEVEDARAKVQADRARLDSAVAARDRATREMERLAVVAPFDGVVVEKLTEVGQWMTPGAPVARIISRGAIDAVLNVPERLVNVVEVGDEVDVTVDALGQTYTGEVVSLTPFGPSAARTFPMKVRLDDDGGRLKAGMSVTAALPVKQQRQVLTVPRSSVQFRGQNQTVWVGQSAQGPMPVAAPVNVEVLFGVGDRYAVAPEAGVGDSALTDGATVVVEGAERLFPTQPLIMLNEPATAELGEEPAGAVPADASQS